MESLQNGVNPIPEQLHRFQRDQYRYRCRSIDTDTWCKRVPERLKIQDSWLSIVDAPSLTEATEDDIATYTCHSVPIATKARYNHNQEIRLLRQPWWRKLGDEYQDEKLDEELDWKVF